MQPTPGLATSQVWEYSALKPGATDLYRSAQTMAKPDHTLCFVSDGEGQIFLHADSAGLGALISCLERLKKKTEAGQSDHDHLKTDAWAGSELTEEIGTEEGQVIHHVKIYGWTDAKAKEHGFQK